MMKNKTIGKLGYNLITERFGILSKMDLWEVDGLHCGSSFEVLVNDEWVADRIEMSKGKYYLVNSKISDDDLEGLKVRF